jgi:DNA (cytosine-5)-methyltransferase 1
MTARLSEARRRQLRLWPRGLDEGWIVDLFAGGGGASTGLEAALGRPVDVALNHDAVAIATHARNHPHAEHLTRNVWRVKPLDVTRGRPVSILWASPDCRHFSIAKGDVPRSKKIRSLANAIVRWANDVRPAVIFVENVREFLSWGPLCKRTRKPLKARAGESFQRWKRGLERRGYVVEHRVLDASLYGAPTRRKRLFVVARCDGLPIVWPAPTHGPGRLALRTAAECIDWSLPCPSIFGRKKPLAEKTMWRIAQGIRRFVLDSPKPFILKVNHGKREDRSADIDEPLSTVTATQRGHAIVVPTLQQSGFGERPGQRARVPGLDVPLGTVVAGGQKHALVAAWLAKHYGDPLRKSGGGVVLGSELAQPIGTITARDHHGPVAVTLATFRGTDPSQPGSASVEEPLPTISAGGIHVAQVRAFLTTYYGSDGTGGQALDEPMRTIRSKHCFGLVTVEGVDYQIVDIGFRMLEPHELLRAQFGKFAEGYDLSLAKSKAAKVRLIGNSVCPELVEALVGANVPPQDRAVAA